MRNSMTLNAECVCMLWVGCWRFVASFIPSLLFSVCLPCKIGNVKNLLKHTLYTFTSINTVLQAFSVTIVFLIFLSLSLLFDSYVDLFSRGTCFVHLKIELKRCSGSMLTYSYTCASNIHIYPAHMMSHRCHISCGGTFKSEFYLYRMQNAISTLIKSNFSIYDHLFFVCFVQMNPDDQLRRFCWNRRKSCTAH